MESDPAARDIRRPRTRRGVTRRADFSPLRRFASAVPARLKAAEATRGRLRTRGSAPPRWCGKIPNMIRSSVLLSALAGLCGAQSIPTQKVVLENPFVRVVDIRVGPGVFEPKHSHARGVTVALSEYDNETIEFPPNGNVSRRHVKFGEVRWVEAVTHEARDVGSTEQHLLRIELKQTAPPPAAPSKADPLDSLIVCKDTQKLIFENEFVRVIQEKVPPGVAQPKHRHAHGMLIPLADSEIESVDDPGGQPVQRRLKLGDAGWREPVVHSVKNVGKTELLNVRIEVK